MRGNIDCREICGCVTPAMIEHRQAAASMQWALAEGSGFLLPSVRENGEKGNLALTLSADDREPLGSPACSGYLG